MSTREGDVAGCLLILGLALAVALVIALLVALVLAAIYYPTSRDLSVFGIVLVLFAVAALAGKR